MYGPALILFKFFSTVFTSHTTRLTVCSGCTTCRGTGRTAKCLPTMDMLQCPKCLCSLIVMDRRPCRCLPSISLSCPEQIQATMIWDGSVHYLIAPRLALCHHSIAGTAQLPPWSGARLSPGLQSKVALLSPRTNAKAKLLVVKPPWYVLLGTFFHLP
jgi:hypothetical protein